MSQSFLTMKLRILIPALAAVFMLSAFVSIPSGDEAVKVVPAEDKIQWMSFEEAVKLMEKDPKPMIFDMYTDWCGWCKRMDATTFSEPVIIKYVNENYYPIKMDGEYKEDITFKGRTYKFIENGRRGYHELPAELMGGKLSYPTIVFLNEEFKIIQSLPGYRTAPEMEKIMKYFGSGAYTDTDWETYSTETKFELEGE